MVNVSFHSLLEPTYYNISAQLATIQDVTRISTRIYNRVLDPGKCIKCIVTITQMDRGRSVTRTVRARS